MENRKLKIENKKTNHQLKKGWQIKKLGDIENIEFLRGNGLNKSLLDDNGQNKCILYGELYTKYKSPIIKNVISKTEFQGKVLSKKGDVLIPGTTTADAYGIAIARALNVDNIMLGGDINIVRTKNKDRRKRSINIYNGISNT